MYKLLLCLRYLRTRYIALASIISVTLGVATMIVVNSVMAGFSTEMRDRIHGLLADVIIETNTLSGVPDPAKHLAMVRQAAGEYIEAMTTTVEVYGLLHFQYHGQWITRPVTLIGIDPEEKAKVGPLADFLENHDKSDGPPSWELAAATMAYRRQWIEKQQWMMHGFDEDSDLFGDPPDASEPGAPDFDAEDQISPDTDVAPASESTDNPFGSFEKNGDTNESPADDSSERPPEFAGDDPPSFDANAPHPAELMMQSANVDIDPAEPLTGRLYIGMGLISFPYEDETGTVQTMMMVKPGDDVKISTVTAGRPPQTTHFNATVVDVFKSGMSEYDSNLIFCNIEHLQKNRGMIDPETGVSSITSIQIKLKDYADAKTVVERLKAVFPPGTYTVKTWEQKQGPLLAAVDIETAILNVLLFLIIAVAGFGILAIFYMIVVEKTRDIGILKALGASSGGVMTIFLSYGLVLGIVGSGAGVVIGLLFVARINEIEKFITWLTGQPVFDERIYYFAVIPTAVSPMMVICVAAAAMAIAVLASILPARRAARLRPVEALRFE